MAKGEAFDRTGKTIHEQLDYLFLQIDGDSNDEVGGDPSSSAEEDDVTVPSSADHGVAPEHGETPATPVQE